MLGRRGGHEVDVVRHAVVRARQLGIELAEQDLRSAGGHPAQEQHQRAVPYSAIGVGRYQLSA